MGNSCYRGEAFCCGSGPATHRITMKCKGIQFPEPSALPNIRDIWSSPLLDTSDNVNHQLFRLQGNQNGHVTDSTESTHPGQLEPRMNNCNMVNSICSQSNEEFKKHKMSTTVTSSDQSKSLLDSKHSSSAAVQVNNGRSFCKDSPGCLVCSKCGLKGNVRNPKKMKNLPRTYALRCKNRGLNGAQKSSSAVTLHTDSVQHTNNVKFCRGSMEKKRKFTSSKKPNIRHSTSTFSPKAPPPIKGDFYFNLLQNKSLTNKKHEQHREKALAANWTHSNRRIVGNNNNIDNNNNFNNNSDYDDDNEDDDDDDDNNIAVNEQISNLDKNWSASELSVSNSAPKKHFDLQQKFSCQSLERHKTSKKQQQQQPMPNYNDRYDSLSENEDADKNASSIFTDGDPVDCIRKKKTDREAKHPQIPSRQNSAPPLPTKSKRHFPKFKARRNYKKTFFLPESARVEQVIADKSDRRINAVCSLYDCDLKVFSKIPKSGILSNVLVFSAVNADQLKKCIRGLDSKMGWCLSSQL